MVSSNHHEVTRILRIDASGRKLNSLSIEIADPIFGFSTPAVLKPLVDQVYRADLEIIRADGGKNDQVKLELAMAQIDRLL